MAQILLVVPMIYAISRLPDFLTDLQYGKLHRTFNAARASAALQQPATQGLRNS
jgi:hypothetical protein